jgi:WD40 repeat protein/energy-coupling factor transporter ATP-binding protein EcfA2
VPRPERPLDPGDDLLTEFAAELRRLRESAGNPTYRELGRRAHYSAGTLSEAAGGRKLPSLAVTLAYVRACGGVPGEWEERWHAVADESRRDGADSPPEPESGEIPPYVGLAAFTPADAGRFFGRERLIEKLAARLTRQRFLAVLGASGSGKSSLLRAGLLPAVSGPAVLLTPGVRPLQECAVKFAAALGVPPGALLEDFAAHPRNLGLAARQLVDGEDTDVVLVVDQFEEVFTLCQDQQDRAQFLDALVTATTEPGSRTRVVLGIRTDFYTHCARHAELAEAMQDAQVLVGPMTTEELRQAISRPAVDAGYRVENALVSRLVADATGQPGVLPLLSHALLETWRRRRGTTLTLAGYESTGGIERAIAQTSEGTFATLSGRQQRLARQIFLRMTALGEGTEDTKRRISRAELDTDDADTAVVLGELATARLVALDDTGIEIAHEALIRGWPRLREWLTEDREGLRVHRQLTEATDAWESVEEDPGWLYRGTRLAIAREWAARQDTALSQRERRFLDASLAVEHAEQERDRRRTRRLRQLVALLAVLLVVAVVATAYAVRAESTATDQRNSALAQKVAGQALAMRATNPALAAQLALAAYRLDPGADERSSLLGMFATPFSTRLTGHTGRVNTVALRPDGQVLVTASWDGTARLWDIHDPRHPAPLGVLTGHTGNVNNVAFSADGRTVATAGFDGTARVWDVTDPARPGPGVVFEQHKGKSYAVAFSPAGPLLATADVTGTLRLYDTADPAHPRLTGELTGHTKYVNNLAFSADGRLLASASADKTARVWDVASRQLLGVVAGHTDVVHSVAFSPDGHTLATASQDQTARLWDVTDPTHPAPLASLGTHKAIVRSVAFAADGRTLATTGFDRTARLWNVADPRQPRELPSLPGHTGAVVSAVFTRDGRTLATASDDQTARLWDLPGPAIPAHTAQTCYAAFGPDKLLATGGYDKVVRLHDLADPAVPRTLATIGGFGDPVCGVAISPDGRTLAAGSWDHTMTLFDITDPVHPGPPVVFNRLHDDVDAVAFSPDGRLLATAGDGHTARLWDLADRLKPVEIARLEGHEDDVHTLAFSPDGRTLATAGWDHTARLWDISAPRAPRPLAKLEGHTDTIFSIAYSPDGKYVATGSADRSVRLWDVTDPATAHLSAVLAGHADNVLSVSFSGDGRTLASGSYDRTIRLWDVASASPHAVLPEERDRVYAVRHAPDGHTMVGTVADGTVRLWETDPDRAAERICAVAAPRITEAEWSASLPGLDYTPPCP